MEVMELEEFYGWCCAIPKINFPKINCLKMENLRKFQKFTSFKISKYWRKLVIFRHILSTGRDLLFPTTIKKVNK